MAEFREAPTLVVLKTQPPSFKTDLQHTILFAEKRDRVLVFTLSPSAQDREDELERRHGPQSTSDVVDPPWDTTPLRMTADSGRERGDGALRSGGGAAAR
jgi:hypothetical protein